MGRPEWILVAVVLSVGLVGATVSAVPGVDGPDATAEAVGVTNSTDAGEPTIGDAEPIGAVGPGVVAQQDQFDLGAQQEFERSTFRVRVDADGHAVWTFRYERPIETDEERSAYEDYAERFRTEETDLFRNFRNQSTELTAAASAETGREMRARNVTRDAGIDQTPTREEGYVELSFEWTNFGRTDDGTVVVGDVFEGGLYLGETQSLIFVAGEDVSFQSIDPDGATSAERLAESETVTWTGERQFADRQPRAVFAVDGAGGGGDTGASVLWLVGGGLLGFLIVAALAIARYGVLQDSESDESTPDAAAEPATDDAETESESAEPATPEEPITDDRRVVQLLEDGGGRMKQTEIVDETEWSKSKVSMLLSEMEEEGTIRKIQVGRENIIALDGHEPEAASSPFEEPE